jgi:hypothetical protein
MEHFQKCVTFPIKQLYIRPKLVELSFYHYAHTQVNDKPTHGQHNPKLMAHMSQYAPRMSQAHKDHIWIQLSFVHIVKQIYDKHKAIWWAWVNVGKAMT